jgi:hypothetical protein
MAKLGLIEDNPDKIRRIKGFLIGSGHEIIEQAESVSGAFKMLRRFMDGKVSLDLLLLDGKLRNDVSPAEFPRPALNPLSIVQPKRDLLKRTLILDALPPPAPITIDPEFFGAQHARAVLEVIAAYKLILPIIAISTESLADKVDSPYHEERPYGNLITHDLIDRDQNLVQLPFIIDDLLTEGHIPDHPHASGL